MTSRVDEKEGRTVLPISVTQVSAAFRCIKQKAWSITGWFNVKMLPADWLGVPGAIRPAGLCNESRIQ